MSFIVFVVCMVLIHAQSEKMNTITDVFHHEGTFGDKVVLYLSQEPICNRLPEKPYMQQAKDTEIVSFFLPLTTISSNQIKQRIMALNNAKKPFYIVNIQEVDKPMHGIKVVFSYNPREIMFDYERFDAIHTHKGIVFWLHNKAKLQEVHGKTDRILKLASKKKPLVVVDCGHGGADPGKIGCFGIKEKDVTLQIGTQLATLLKEHDFRVQMTRADDRSLKLAQRTQCANNTNADLFISIHANASKHERVAGLETYYLSCNDFKKLQDWINPYQHFFIGKEKNSRQLACCVHNELIKQVSPFYTINDRRVKSAVCQVLLGTQMPATLVELGFLTNPSEAIFLANNDNQKLIARGLFNGIYKYCTYNN